MSSKFAIILLVLAFSAIADAKAKISIKQKVCKTAKCPVGWSEFQDSCYLVRFCGKKFEKIFLRQLHQILLSPLDAQLNSPGTKVSLFATR